MNLYRLHLVAFASTVLHSFVAFAAEEPIDFNKARRLFERQNRGETLTQEEKAYVERALAERKGRPQPPQKPAPWTEHLTPLTDLGTGKYKEQDGGLYGGGSNEPPRAHLAAALGEVAKIRPLDTAGGPAPDGKIGLMSVGMSNTSQEFSSFIQKVKADPDVSPSLVLVEGAQGGQTGMRWADPNAPLWKVLDSRLQATGVSAKQVQVVWLKQAEAGPASLGAFPRHAETLKANLAKGIPLLKERFPNLRVAYLSSRTYGGYATTMLNPEPYAYEGAFSMRWLIQDQIAGKPELNFDPAKGEVKSPLLLWGPYLWADGQTPRKSDGLAYKPDDFVGDGTHPSQTGRIKVADVMLRFFKTDPTARKWFCIQK